MDLDTVEAGTQRAFGAGAELLYDQRDLVQFERARHRKFRFTVSGEGMTLGTDGRGRHRRLAIGLQVDVRLAAHMPELQHNSPALGVDSIRNALPACDLAVGIDARCARIAIALERYGRRLRNYKTTPEARWR